MSAVLQRWAVRVITVVLALLAVVLGVRSATVPTAGVPAAPVPAGPASPSPYAGDAGAGARR